MGMYLEMYENRKIEGVLKGWRKKHKNDFFKKQNLKKNI